MSTVELRIVDAEHLQRIIEKQPNCLVRAGIDGVLLAVNDAALGLLGAREIGQVLGTPLTARIVPEHHELWNAFAATVGADAARSLECDLTDLTGARRTILFHGVPLLDHPDGIPSMMLGARDVSALRRLETSQETQSRRHPDQTADQASQRALADRDQLEQLLKAGRKHLETQRVQLAEAVAERQRLETLLQEREAEGERLTDEQAAALHRSLTEQHQRDLQSAADAAHQQLEGVRTQLTEAAAERQRLETLLRERETAHQSAIDEQADLQRAATDQHRLKLQSAADEARAQVDAVRAELRQEAAERLRLETLLQERATEHQRAIDEQVAFQRTLTEQHQLDLQSVAQEAQQLVDGLQTQLMEEAAERLRLGSLLQERATEHQRASDEQAAFQRTLTEHHQRDLQSAAEEAQQVVEGLRTQLTEAAAERQRLEAELAQRDDQLIDELAAERSRFDGVLAASALKQREMAQALADQGVELQYVELTAKQLAPLAVTGRLALELGAELQTIVEAMDARAAALLVDCPLEAACREAVEVLRGDAIRLRSLTRQIELASADTQTVSSHS